MIQELQLELIIDEIKKIETALFTDCSPSVLKFPTSVISVDKVDANGEIWFSLKKPYEDISGLEHSFFAHLQFYNKAYNSDLAVDGVAFLEAFCQPDETNLSIDSGVVRIHFHITDAEYYKRRKPAKNLLDNLVRAFNTLRYDKLEPVLKVHLSRQNIWQNVFSLF